MVAIDSIRLAEEIARELVDDTTAPWNGRVVDFAVDADRSVDGEDFIWVYALTSEADDDAAPTLDTAGRFAFRERFAERYGTTRNAEPAVVHFKPAFSRNGPLTTEAGS